eukprot:1821844-Rhodomonas_salina.1
MMRAALRVRLGDLKLARAPSQARNFSCSIQLSSSLSSAAVSVPGVPGVPQYPGTAQCVAAAAAIDAIMMSLGSHVAGVL